MKECVVVLGMHRSGTSALAGMLSALGVYPGGELLEASSSNKKGYFENSNAYTLNKEILLAMNSSWDDERFQYNKLEPKLEEEFIEKAKEILAQDYKFIESFVLKDPRMCLLFPIWEAALLQLDIKIKPIFIIRNPMEVSLSLSRRNSISEEKSLILWANHYFQAEMHTRKYKRLIILYNELLYETTDVIDDIESFLEINFDKNIKTEASGFLEKGIKNNRLAQASISGIPHIFNSLYVELTSKVFDGKKIKQLNSEFYKSVEFYQSYKDSEVNELMSKNLMLKGQLRDSIDMVGENIKNGNKLHHAIKSAHSNDSNEGLYKKIAMIYSRQVDIVIPVFNALEFVKECLDSILTENSECIGNIIIINDGSGDETTSYLREISQKEDLITLVEIEVNQGYTKTVNVGLEKSDAEYVVLLNSDTVVSKNWLEKLIDCAEGSDNIGIVGPMSNAASWQSVPQLLDVDGQFKVNELPENMTVSQMSQLVADSISPVYPTVPVVNGFCFLIKRSVINSIGIMDEESFPTGYGEENDYCIRAKDAGFLLVIADDCYVYHSKSKSFGSARRNELSKAGSEALIKKHGKERIDNLVKDVKAIKSFEATRRAVDTSLNQYKKITETPSYENLNILFILPSPGAGGGSHSIVQEVMAMQSLGVNAVIGIESKNLISTYKRYSDINTVKDLFVGYDNASLLGVAKNYDVVIATIFYSVDLVKSIIDVYPHILPVYYVQDYEPMFFTKKDPRREEASASYSTIRDMLLFAKTDWIARQVAIFHGVPVRKVSPSIDHEIYKQLQITAKNNEKIKLVAMIRPQTPYRGAERTMELLAKVKHHFKNKLEIHIFGSDESHEGFDNLREDFDFHNHGVLDRPGVAACLQESDIFIDLSDYQAFGRTSLEAMACGCTAMLPCHGGGDEYAIDDYNALVVDPFDENESHLRLMSLLDNSEKLESMKKAGLDTASRYSPQKAALSELEIFAKYLTVHRELYPKSDKTSICIIPVRRDDKEPVGSAFVRLIQPYTQNDALDEKWNIYIFDGDDLPSPAEADIVIIQRDALGLDRKRIANWLLQWRVAGKRTILELDDDLFDAEGLYKRTNGNKNEIKARADEIVWLTGAVDAVICSTSQLSLLASEYNENVYLIPNYIDAKLWGINEKKLKQNSATNNSVVKIGYIGTPTHDDDLLIIVEAMKRIKDEYGEKVQIEVIGAFQKNLSKPLFGESVGLPKDTTYPSFVDWLKLRVDWDIAVIPLANNRFNESKSHLKYLECSALGLASICSNVLVYSNIVKNNDTGILVENNSDDWYKSIKLLIDNSSLRGELARKAYLDIIENHTSESNVDKYSNVLSAIENLPLGSEVPQALKVGFVEVSDRRNRLLAKFKKNPHLFFADSKNKLIRPIKFLFKKR